MHNSFMGALLAHAKAAKDEPSKLAVGDSVVILHPDYRNVEAVIVQSTTNMFGAPLFDVRLSGTDRVTCFYPHELVKS